MRLSQAFWLLFKQLEAFVDPFAYINRMNILSFVESSELKLKIVMAREMPKIKINKPPPATLTITTKRITHKEIQHVGNGFSLLLLWAHAICFAFR